MYIVLERREGEEGKDDCVGMQEGFVTRMGKRIVGKSGRGGGSGACSIWRV